MSVSRPMFSEPCVAFSVSSALSPEGFNTEDTEHTEKKNPAIRPELFRHP